MFLASAFCKPTKTANITAKIAVLIPYPKLRDIDSASPAVSPKVVAAILMIQNSNVTSGTLLKLLDKYPIGERLRRNPNFDLQLTEEQLSKIDYTKKDEAISKVENIMKKYTDAIMTTLRKSDNLAATQTWIAEYLKVKKSKGEDVNNINWELELENPDQEAASAAEMAVSKTQNVSDVSLGSRQMTRKQYQASKNILFNLAGFALNAKSRLIIDTRNLFLGKENKAKLARSLVFGYTAQIAAYMAISEVIRNAYGDIADSIVNSTNDDEDEARKIQEKENKSNEQIEIDKKNKDDRERKRITTNVVKEALFSGVPEDITNAIMYGANELIAISYYDEIDALMSEIDELKPYAEKDNNDKITLKLKEQELENLVKKKEFFNVFDQNGRSYGPISMYIDLFSKLGEKAQKSKIEDLTPKEQRLLYYMMAGDALAILGIDEGTVKSIRNKTWQELKKKLEEKYGGKEITIKTKAKKGE